MPCLLPVNSGVVFAMQRDPPPPPPTSGQLAAARGWEVSCSPSLHTALPFQSRLQIIEVGPRPRRIAGTPQPAVGAEV